MSNELQKIPEENQSAFSSNDGYKVAMEIATTLSKSDLVPDKYKGKPGNCIIALDVARQVKTSPLIVMQNLDIIKGKPSWSSTYVSGAIRSKYKKVKCILDGEGMKRGCKVIAYDFDGDIIEGTRVTLQMAKDEGWIDKAGSKWKTMPDQMLQYRAHSFFGRVHCPEILIGMQTEYEVYDVAGNSEKKEEIENPFVEDIPVTKSVETDNIEDAVIVEEKTEDQNDFSIPAPKDELFKSQPTCSGCRKEVTEKVKNYSEQNFGKILCYDCQKK